MNKKINSIDDIKSGFVVVLRSGEKFMCMRYNNFEKCFVSSCRERSNIKNLKKYNGLKFGKKAKDDVHDIVKVYGLASDHKNIFDFSDLDKNRPLLYSEKRVMTVEEIENELGYNIEIIKNMS